MKLVLHIVSAVPLLVSLLNARYLQKKESSQAVLELPIQRFEYAGISGDTLTRRSKQLTAIAQNFGTAYITQLAVGTPNDGGTGVQNVLLQLDTGDSTLWMNSVSNPICKAGDKCANYGTFNPHLSATKPPVKKAPFSVAYDNADKGSGIVYKDQITIGVTHLNDVEFGLATSSNSPLGAIGLGYYQLQESWRSRSKNTAIPTLTQVLKAKGIINLQAYSIFLNRENAPTGSIIFGGVDTNKFSDKLSTLPVQKDHGEFTQLLVKLNSVSYAGTKSSAIDALLDTGSSFTVLLPKTANAIRDAVKAEYDEKGRNYYVSCKLKGSKDTINFSFDGITIKVPLGSFVLARDPDLPFPSPKTGEILCGWGIFEIGPDQEPQAILGANFLRSAYLVFDLSNNEISIAQASYSSSASSIKEIPKGGVTALDLIGAGTDELNTDETAAYSTSPETQIATGDISNLIPEQASPGIDTTQPGQTTDQDQDQPTQEETGSNLQPLAEMTDLENPVQQTNNRPLRPSQGDLALQPGVQNLETQSTQQTTDEDVDTQPPAPSPEQNFESEPSSESFDQPPVG